MRKINKDEDEYDGFLICPGQSKKQINQFKRLFVQDNLNHVNKKNYYLQMRKIHPMHKNSFYALDVFVEKELVGHFSVQIISAQLSTDVFKIINEQSEKLFKEETIYGINDFEGLDRVNNSLYGGYGNFEPYPTVSSKAAALWYKIATNRFFNNGNKRTAFLSAIYLLVGNFYTFDVTDVNTMYDMSLDAANKKINKNKIEKFINEHIALDYDHMASALTNEEFVYSQTLSFTNSINV